MPGAKIQFRKAQDEDLNALLAIESSCFETDKLSKRSFKHWLQVPHGILLVACDNQRPVAYGLVWLHKGTRLARLYSLAVAPDFRGKHIAEQLVTRLEQAAAEQGRIAMRLEVSENNKAAITLYERLGYTIFDAFTQYYEDDSDALRMQKCIHPLDQAKIKSRVPWYQQTTDFTCGPSALMMAMHSLNQKLVLNQETELDIWRQATSIFMTSGHGGTHPFGLALAAADRGFHVEVLINTQDTPFLDGVRSENKKNVLHVVHQQFAQRAQQNPHIHIHQSDVSQIQVQTWLNADYAVLVLISTYRLDGKKAPHWVVVTHIDEHCLYVHDPDCDEQSAIDCQHVPIARQDFYKMSAFGSSKLRTALAIRLEGISDAL